MSIDTELDKVSKLRELLVGDELKGLDFQINHKFNELKNYTTELVAQMSKTNEANINTAFTTINKNLESFASNLSTKEAQQQKAYQEAFDHVGSKISKSAELFAQKNVGDAEQISNIKHTVETMAKEIQSLKLTKVDRKSLAEIFKLIESDLNDDE